MFCTLLYLYSGNAREYSMGGWFCQYLHANSQHSPMLAPGLGTGEFYARRKSAE